MKNAQNKSKNNTFIPNDFKGVSSGDTEIEEIGFLAQLKQLLKENEDDKTPFFLKVIILAGFIAIILTAFFLSTFL